MANGEISGPPAVDFYSMLSGLGDEIKKGQAARVASDVNAARARAVSSFSQLDPNSPDYGKSVQSLAAGLHPADQDGQFKFIGLAHQAQEAAHRDKREKIEDDWSDTTRADSLRAHADSIALQKQTAARLDNKPFEIEVPGPFGSVTKQTVVRGPDGSIKPLSIVSAPPATAPQPDAPATAQPAPGVVPQPAGSGAQPAAAPGTAAPAPAVDLEAVDPASGRRETWLKSRPANEQAYIKKIADYEIDPRTTSTKGGMRENVLSSVAQYDPTYNQNEFGTRAKAMRDFGTGPQGNSVRSFDVAIDHLDLLKKYTKALDSGDVRAVNSLRNRWLEETGSPLPTNIQAVAPIVGAEVSKAVIGSNNALADREELRAPLRSANSVPQINGAIEAYQGLMAGQLKGLKKQYEDTTGKKNFDSRVRETTRNVLLGKGADGATGDSSSQPNVTSTGVKWSIQ